MLLLIRNEQEDKHMIQLTKRTAKVNPEQYILPGKCMSKDRNNTLRFKRNHR